MEFEVLYDISLSEVYFEPLLILEYEANIGVTMVYATRLPLQP